MNSIFNKLFLLVAISNILIGFDCPADSAYRVDTRIRLNNGALNPAYGKVIATGLGTCLDIVSGAVNSDSVLSIVILCSNNDPVYGIEFNLHHDAGNILTYDKLNYGDHISTPALLAGYPTGNGPKIVGYGLDSVLIKPDAGNDSLMTINFILADDSASFPDSIQFWLGSVITANFDPEEGYLNTAAAYPDSSSAVKIAIATVSTDYLALQPSRYTLDQNYPNPFNPWTKIRYSVPVQSLVQIRIYNILGQAVTELVNQVMQPGYYDLIWQGRDRNRNQVASGIYLYELRAGNSVIVKKMVYLR